jgi:SAM-dependent methyltransferase
MSNRDDQARAWSEAATSYEAEFVDPYRDDVRNPLLQFLPRIKSAKRKVAADLGCGAGPLLPLLAARFGQVHAIDFAPAMLARARERCRDVANVEFHERSLTDLSVLAGKIDVAVAVNSLVLPEIGRLEEVLRQVHACLKPGGIFCGILPAIDAVHYTTMLMVDRALGTGMPDDKARQNAAQHVEHALYDFAFSDFRFRGLHQHFWQPFEVGYRLRRAGFTGVRLSKVHLSWDQFACGKELTKYPPPWDWFFAARRPPDK